LVIAPKIPIGENEPPPAPRLMAIPIRAGRIRYWAAKPIATGARIATVAGVAAPIPAIRAQIANIAQGTNATRPRTVRMDAWISQSTVPFFLASANR
jgi:hypothetical protein